MKFFVIVVFSGIIFRETSLMINVTFISNGKYHSNEIISNLSNIHSQHLCICHCYALLNCSIANYDGSHRECVLFSSVLQLEQIHVIPIEKNAVLIIINDRNTVPGEWINPRNDFERIFFC